MRKFFFWIFESPTLLKLGLEGKLYRVSGLELTKLVSCDGSRWIWSSVDHQHSSLYIMQKTMKKHVFFLLNRYLSSYGRVFALFFFFPKVKGRVERGSCLRSSCQNLFSKIQIIHSRSAHIWPGYHCSPFHSHSKLQKSCVKVGFVGGNWSKVLSARMLTKKLITGHAATGK